MQKSILFSVAALFTMTACKEAPVAQPAVTETQPNFDVQALPVAKSGSIEGRIELNPTLKAQANEGDTIFLIARNATTNSTIAVAKLAAPKEFPLPFRLNADNLMRPGSSLSGRVRLLARLDKDSDAMSKNPGDLVGEVKDLVEVTPDSTTQDVVLTLDSAL